MGSDTPRWHAYAAALIALVSSCAQPCEVVCVGDGLPLPVMCAHLSRTQPVLAITALQEHAAAHQWLAAACQLLQGQGLDADSKGICGGSCSSPGVSAAAAAAVGGGVCGGTAAAVKVSRPAPYFKRLAHVAAARQAAGTASEWHGDSGGGPEAGASFRVSEPVQGGSLPLVPPLLLLAEPHFSAYEGMLPEMHLRFWHDFESIR